MADQNHNININIKETGAAAATNNVANLNKELDKTKGASSSTGNAISGLADKVKDFTMSSLEGASGLGEFAGTLVKFAGPVGAAITAVTALATAIEANALAMAAAADDAAEMADKLGVTTTRLVELTLIANENGTSVESLQKTYDKLSKSLSKLDEDNVKSVNSFRGLGIAIEDLAGLSEVEIAGKLVANWEAMGRSTEATANIIQLLGPSFREQIPAIKAAADAGEDYAERVRKYGGVASKELEDLGAKHEVASSNIGLAWTNLRNHLADLTGSMTLSFKEWLAGMLKSLADFVAKWNDGIGIIGRFQLEMQARQISMQRNGALSGNLASNWRPIYDELYNQQRQTNADNANEIARFSNQASATAASRVRPLAPIKAPGKGDKDTGTAVDLSYMSMQGLTDPAVVERYQRQIEEQRRRDSEQLRQLQEREDERNRTNIARLVGVGAEARSAVNFENMTRGMGRIDREAFGEMEKVSATASRAIADLNKNLEGYEDRVKAIKDAEQESLDAIRTAAEERKASTEDWTKGASKAFTDYIDSIKDVSSQTETVFTNAFQSMEDAIVKFATTGKLSIKDLVKTIIAEITRILVRRAIVQFIAMFAGSGNTATGLNLPAGAGNSVNLVNGGAFADGGEPPMGKVSLVGERGPELFVPKTMGTIVPNEQLGGPKVVNQINISVGEIDSEQRQQQLVRLVDQVVTTKTNEALNNYMRNRAAYAR